jgi:hypothetical protein
MSTQQEKARSTTKMVDAVCVMRWIGYLSGAVSFVHLKNVVSTEAYQTHGHCTHPFVNPHYFCSPQQKICFYPFVPLVFVNSK